MAKQNENLQKDQNELLAFVEKSDLGEREKEQMKQNLLEIFKFEDGLDENLASLKASTQSLQEFRASISTTLSSVRHQVIETRMAQRDKEFETLHNPSKEKQDEYLKANLADLKALSKAGLESAKAKLEATRKKIETKFAGKENEALEFSPKFKEQIKSLFNNPNEGGKNVK